MHKMGLNGAPMADLYIDDCRVPKENRLGGEGQGARIFSDSMEWERTYILAWQIGVMERQVAEAARYAQERKLRRDAGDLRGVGSKPRAGSFRMQFRSMADMLCHRNGNRARTAGRRGRTDLLRNLGSSTQYHLR